MWVQKIVPGPLQDQPVLLLDEPSSNPYLCHYLLWTLETCYVSKAGFKLCSCLLSAGLQVEANTPRFNFCFSEVACLRCPGWA